MITINETNLPGVMLIKPEVFEDHRGQYVEIYNAKNYASPVIGLPPFVQDDISVSSRNVLRGIHGDDKTWKLISCLYGRIYLVVLCCDDVSPHKGMWQSFVLSDTNRHQVLVPPKHGNGHYVLSEKAVFHYKQTEYYDPTSQFTIPWNHVDYDIWWPCKDPILSQRDQK